MDSVGDIDVPIVFISLAFFMELSNSNREVNYFSSFLNVSGNSALNGIILFKVLCNWKLMLKIVFQHTTIKLLIFPNKSSYIELILPTI